MPVKSEKFIAEAIQIDSKFQQIQSSSEFKKFFYHVVTPEDYLHNNKTSREAAKRYVCSFLR